jgi:penicillin amidase
MGDPERDEEVIAARWGLAEAAHDMDAMLAMLHASNVEEAMLALRGYDSVSGNFCVADLAGDIAYQYTGRIPKRPCRVTPVPGWDGVHEWDGDVPKAELPSEVNPANGFIVTANNRTTVPDYPHYLTYLHTGFRADRLRELMDGVEQFSADGMERLQSDQVSIHARTLAAAFAKAEASTGDGRRVRALLQGWTGTMPPDSAAALAWDSVCEALCDRTVAAYYRAAPGLPPFTAVELRRVLFDQVTADSPLMLAGYTSWDSAIAESLDTAGQSLSARFGPDTAAWRWDAVHVASWRHNLGRDAEFAATLNVGEIPVGGHGDTVFCTMVQDGTASTHGVSYRQVIDLADVNAMRICIPPGNSGQPGSPHYADNIERWRTVDYHPLHVGWADIEANAEATLQLTPRG